MRYALALDIGGTKIEGVLFDEKYRQLKKERRYFDKDNSSAIVDSSRKDVLKMIDDMITRLSHGYRIAGVGISMPDIISPDGMIGNDGKITALRSFNLSRHIMKKHRTASITMNDADCFALAETMLGAGKGRRVVIGVIYGTGIGAGIVIDGKPYSGEHGSAGEFGYNLVNPAGPRCHGGQRGHVEAYAGGPFLVKNYKDAGGKIKDPDPDKIFHSKDPVAKRVIGESLEMFGAGLASLVNIFDPGVIVLGGGMSNLPVYRKLNSLTKKYSREFLRKHVKIVKNRLGDSAGVYGAAALILSK